MLKILAETRGPFQLSDIALGQLLPAHRPGVIISSNFVQTRIGANQIKVLGEVKAEATDADFVSYLKEADGDHQLAIDSFLSEFGADNVGEKVSTSAKNPPRRRGRKIEGAADE